MSKAKPFRERLREIREARDRRIMAALARGRTYQEIANDEGITRQRVQQIRASLEKGPR